MITLTQRNTVMTFEGHSFMQINYGEKQHYSKFEHMLLLHLHFLDKFGGSFVFVHVVN